MDIYGVNRFYDGTKIIDKTDWFFNWDDAVFATGQKDSSRIIINGIYHDDDSFCEPWIETIGQVKAK